MCGRKEGAVDVMKNEFGDNFFGDKAFGVDEEIIGVAEGRKQVGGTRREMGRGWRCVGEERRLVGG